MRHPLDKTNNEQRTTNGGCDWNAVRPACLSAKHEKRRLTPWRPRVLTPRKPRRGRRDALRSSRIRRPPNNTNNDQRTTPTPQNKDVDLPSLSLAIQKAYHVDWCSLSKL